MDGLVGLVAAAGWASGLNLYLVVALLGIGGRTGLVELPAALTRTDVIVVALLLFVLEFVADKVPYLDNVWDLWHTVIRPVGAAALGLLLTGEAETWQQALGAAGSGGLAMAAHVTKATVRAALNTSPEPASNLVVSLGEDGLVAAVLWFAVTNPLVALVLVVVLLVGGLAVTVALFGAARRGLQARRDRRRRRRTRTGSPPSGGSR